ncbi:metallophosphoesterase family protein [Thermithiobacillus plumbiphilus]|uniref:Phosphoesterase n=1 Tax=Thermithiobacillus plumbiphilus TaxID=1729899 RepID=A0ABU9D808_9PROT
MHRDQNAHSVAQKGSEVSASGLDTDWRGLERVRLAIVSDTHGQLDARIGELVAGCDLAVHAGDIMGAAVLAALQPRLGQVLAVRGNNDVPEKWPGSELALLSGIPLEVSLMLPGGDLVVVHGDRAGPTKTRHARLRALYPAARAIVYGHSHQLICDTAQTPWVLNPGAAGRVRTFGGPSCLILEAGTTDWQVRAQRFPA